MNGVAITLLVLPRQDIKDIAAYLHSLPGTMVVRR